MKSEPQSPPIVLSVTDLRIEAKANDGWIEIVKGVNLTLRRGEVLGLVGESGAGKSTIGLAALGYFRPGCRRTRGSVRFGETDVLGLTEAKRRTLRGTQVAYVAQSAAASFNPAKRLMDQIVEAAVTRGGMQRAVAEQRAVALFRSLQLPNPEIFGKRYPHQVSGGQLQRAMTAMAMICQPDLIVFDEPTTALDVTVQAQILDLLRRLQDSHAMAMILITHNFGVVAEMCDDVAVMYAGRIVECGPVAQVLSRPRMRYTEALLRSVPRLDSAPHARLPVIDGRPPDLVSPPAGCRFAPRCAHRSERCEREAPPFVSDGEGRRFACWHPTGDEC